MANTETKSDTFDISFLSEAGVRGGIKTYERIGYSKLAVRRDEAGGRIWVTFGGVKKDKNP